MYFYHSVSFRWNDAPSQEKDDRRVSCEREMFIKWRERTVYMQNHLLPSPLTLPEQKERMKWNYNCPSPSSPPLLSASFPWLIHFIRDITHITQLPLEISRFWTKGEAEEKREIKMMMTRKRDHFISMISCRCTCSVHPWDDICYDFSPSSFHCFIRRGSKWSECQPRDLFLSIITLLLF